MSDESGKSVGNIELATAIGMLRDQLLKAREDGAKSEIQLPVESMTVELTVTATTTAEGKASFVVPIVNVQLGGGGGRERAAEQKITVVFGGPRDRSNRPVPIAASKGPGG
jgi:hypothetical protein